MKGTPRKSLGIKEIAAEWDGRDSLGRLQLIMDNIDLFWSLRLITRSEIAMVDAMHESAREYVIQREDQPWFTSINLNKTFATQQHREKLKAALSAVFSKQSSEEFKEAA